MKKLEEIEFFEGLIQSTENELIQKAVANGRIPLGYNCYMVPRPLLSVGKAFPYRIFAPEVQSTEIADYYMSSVLCSCSRSVLETGLNGGYDFLDGMIWANSCQHSTKCGQHFEMKKINSDKEKFFVEFIEAPRKTDIQDLNLYVKGLKKAAAKISEKYGIDMSIEALRQSIIKHNEFNSMLKEISDLRKDEHPKITGSEFHKVMAATMVTPNDMLKEPIKKLQKSLDEREGLSNYRARIMVVGPFLDNPRFVELIEEQGALVVADRYCFGSQPGLEPIPVEGNPYFNLANYYFNTCECPRMINNSQMRLDKLMERISEFNIDGVVIETVKFCDMWGYELLTMEKGLRSAGIPVVKIEREYTNASEGQFRTRIQAFIESIESKRISKQISKGVI